MPINPQIPLQAPAPDLGNALAQGLRTASLIERRNALSDLTQQRAEAAEAQQQRGQATRNALAVLQDPNRNQAEREAALSVLGQTEQGREIVNNLRERQVEQEASFREDAKQEIPRIAAEMQQFDDPQTALSVMQREFQNTQNPLVRRSLAQNMKRIAEGGQQALNQIQQEDKPRLASFRATGQLERPEKPDRLSKSDLVKVQTEEGTRFVRASEAPGRQPAQEEGSALSAGTISDIALTQRAAGRETGIPQVDQLSRKQAQSLLDPESEFDFQLDQFGNVVKINKRTGEVIRPEQSPGQASQVRKTAQEAEPSEGREGVFAEIEEGTGTKSSMKAFVNRYLSPALGLVPGVEGVPFPQTAEARTAIRAFNQNAKTALVNNPRFPVAEQQTVQKFLPNPDLIFEDPDRARASLKQLHSFLMDKRDQAQKSIRSGNITQKEVGRLANQIESINRVLELMGDPSVEQRSEQEGLPEGIPENSRRIGTKNGNPVFEAPDGRQFVVE